jgi:starvation-inducible outer membrane lipoprotein
MNKISLILIACVLLTSCVTSQLQTKQETAYGKTFKCSYQNDQPYTGKTVYRAALDYYWVTEYKDGQFVIQNHYFIDHKTKEHRLMFVKEIEDGTVTKVKDGVVDSSE